MKTDSCFELGHICKIHGVKGEVVIHLDADDPGKYENLESVYILVKKRLVPFFIQHMNLRGNQAIVKFEGLDGIDRARKLLACRIYLPLDLLPVLDDDDYYLHELIGYTVVDSVSGKLGKVTSIYEANGNRLIAMDYREKEVLIPLDKSLVRRVDKKKKEVFTDLPEGLLEIYLNS